jgi:uncharacterized protein YgiM (DUF1202 family)
MKTMSAASSYQKSIAESMNPSFFQNLTKTMSAASLYQKSIDEIIGKNHFQQAVNAFAEQSNLLAALDIVAHSDEVFGPNLVEYDLDHQLQEIGAAKDTASFVKAFSNLSPKFKYILIFIFFALLNRAVSIADNVTANIITPHVEKLINNPEATEREKVKKLRTFGLDGLDLSNLRFVTTEHLLLRENPSTSSEIKDELRLGQVVTVINKQRNWMEISYADEDESIVQGWVFSRYTAKFNK